MDVISILTKKKQDVTAFEVKVHADRSEDYPKVYTRAELEYQVTGHNINETDVLRAIELSIQKYCPVHAMLSQAFAGLADEELGAMAALTRSEDSPPGFMASNCVVSIRNCTPAKRMGS